ncbi:MAG: ATP-binding protein [Oscillospiraceae bacterium]|jgi:DNA replication protein DnaC|nr:ATP-binding protein [Oscillospiraceae bacterium]
MALDGKLLAQARQALSERRGAREARRRGREREVFARSPRAARLSAELVSAMRGLFALALDYGAPESSVGALDAKGKALRAELGRECLALGLPENYLDDAPLCEKCGDTGFIGAKICSCLEELYKTEQRKALSSLFKLGGESFETFRIELYDETDDAGYRVREHMQMVFEFCRRYAREFGQGSFNLLMSGAPGLGKTFLSAAIARVVADGGCSVVYDTFTSIFSRLEEEKFSRDDEDSAEARGETKRYRECELLIADDLGAELTTAFTTSALYELVNTRLITGRKTIISTNLDPEELSRRYSPQIASRLEGEYKILRFYGRDIRLKKRDAP